MGGKRHQTRELALQALYEIDTVGRDIEVAMQHIVSQNALSGENEAFIRELIEGVLNHHDEIDGSIKKYAPAWPVDQIAIIDRNILRLAIFEILFDNKVPIKVAVSEAVELAKSFGSDASAKFVNGVLGSISVLSGR